MKTCQGCGTNTATVYAVWHITDAGRVVEAGGAYVCPTCLDSLECAGAHIAKREAVPA